MKWLSYWNISYHYFYFYILSETLRNSNTILTKRLVLLKIFRIENKLPDQLLAQFLFYKLIWIFREDLENRGWAGQWRAELTSVVFPLDVQLIKVHRIFINLSSEIIQINDYKMMWLISDYDLIPSCLDTNNEVPAVSQVSGCKWIVRGHVRDP